MRTAITALVQNRAVGRCEYCGMLETLSDFKFHIEHAIARQHRGSNSPHNLALSCGFCNLHKGPNLSGVDPQTGKIVTLFHPRRQDWKAHFRWRGARILGISECGRATVVTLAMNNPNQLAMRKWQIDEGLLTPP